MIRVRRFDEGGGWCGSPLAGWRRKNLEMAVNVGLLLLSKLAVSTEQDIPGRCRQISVIELDGQALIQRDEQLDVSGADLIGQIRMHLFEYICLNTGPVCSGRYTEVLIRGGMLVRKPMAILARKRFVPIPTVTVMPVVRSASRIIIIVNSQGELIEVQVTRHIHEDFIDGVDMDILRCDVFEIHLVDSGDADHIQSHPGRRNKIADGQIR